MPATLLVTNRYQNGKLTGQAFADGSTYQYGYLVSSKGESKAAVVSSADGTVYDVLFGERGAAVHLRSTPPHELTAPARSI